LVTKTNPRGCGAIGTLLRKSFRELRQLCSGIRRIISNPLDLHPVGWPPRQEEIDKIAKQTLERTGAISERLWRHVSSEEKVVEMIFEHCRRKGFPYYDLTLWERVKEFEKIRRPKRIIRKGIVAQNMTGLGLAWYHFPHSWEIRCGSGRTPMEAFHDDDLLKDAIRARIRNDTLFNDTKLRKTLKIYSGVQSVSNFRPTAAKAIYDEHCDGTTWDMCAGFGGRLLGALASRRVKRYIGTDPSRRTYEGLCRLREDYLFWREKGLLPSRTKEIELHQIGSEDFRPEPGSVDLCFTSPPYFDTERYSDEETQSYVKFPTPREWLEGFLGQTLENCRIALKESGRLIINIADVKRYPNLTVDFLELAERKGFVLEEELKLALSSINGTGFKYEPVYVFHLKGWEGKRHRKGSIFYWLS